MRTKSLRMASAVRLFDDPRSRPASREASRDDRDVEELERARDGDPFPAGKRQNLARAVPVADLEHGHRERPVGRRR